MSTPRSSSDGAETRRTPDVLVVGRLLADIYPNQLETPLAEVESFTRFVGGFAGNVATGLARLGVGARILSRIGDDGHGEFCRAFLAREGVDTSWLGVDPTYRTGLAFCEAWPPDHFPITYYRTPTCPDWEIGLDDFPMVAAREIPWCLLTGTGLARSPSRDVHFALAEERTGTQTVLDLDWRSMLWDGTRTYRGYVRALAPLVDLVIGNESEFEAAFGGNPLQAARGVLDLGPRTAILKRGGAGVRAITAEGEEDVPGLPIAVVNGLGAGDAFCASLLEGLLRGVPLGEACRRGNAAGAIVASRLSCSLAMPTRDEVDSLLATGEVPAQPS
jgi:5-dehydro-2-deoxygluconokinase